jgi:hypothetical protein
MAVTKNATDERKFVFTTKLVEEITDKINDGVVVKRYQNPWFKSEIGVKRAGITFAMTPDEIQEYIRCKLDIQYFAEKYCRIKTEDGSIQNIKLRDYQKKILDLYTNSRFSILCGSRQIGKCSVFNTVVQISDIKFERIGILYYNIIKTYRKLTFLERLKIKLYNIIYRLDNKHI